MAALSVKGLSIANSEEVEILTCRKVLEFAVKVGFQDVVMEGDNVTVIKGLIATKPNKSLLGNIYKDVEVFQLVVLDVVLMELPIL